VGFEPRRLIASTHHIDSSWRLSRYNGRNCHSRVQYRYRQLFGNRAKMPLLISNVGLKE
jgi:hypothetical protein